MVLSRGLVLYKSHCHHHHQHHQYHHHLHHYNDNLYTVAWADLMGLQTDTHMLFGTPLAQIDTRIETVVGKWLGLFVCRHLNVIIFGPVWLPPFRLSSSLLLSSFCCCLSFFFYLTKTVSVESVRVYFCHRLSSIGEYILQVLFLTCRHLFTATRKRL